MKGSHTTSVANNMYMKDLFLILDELKLDSVCILASLLFHFLSFSHQKSNFLFLFFSSLLSSPSHPLSC